ncbi:hypothetical protein F511_27727 [Dorcoceras hygrometricum]|uniref:Uncharacterized protein n=1 Tax=Dorcoceras hygrometricum TaxID=472368 RepID=A0A2Z7CU39_9LAMI|nr:hypothetical protein F511_27727 [Dorcoceras hygrometricum]
MASRKRSISNDADVSSLNKELDEALCPICMDHPHNAVYLICSSHINGCRSFICDTSYRHSNCLDRFKKLGEDNPDRLSAPSLANEGHVDSIGTSNGNSTTLSDINVNHGDISLTAGNSAALVGIPGGSRQNSSHDVNPYVENVHPTSWEILNLDETHEEKLEKTSNLKCPLCRGDVLGWKVVEDARKNLNLKSRSCSHESCSFVGNYSELRRHARSVHPTIRPADVDPSRQSAWHRLEHQREYNDIVSAIRSTMPGAVVFGDYVIDNNERFSGERDTGGGVSEGGRWLSTFFLFHMIGSMESGVDLRGGRSRMLYRHRRTGGTFSRRRYLWGENLLGLRENDDDRDEASRDDIPDLNIDISDDAPPNPRRSRRSTRARTHEDQP